MGSAATRISGKLHDIGGLQVRRLLPAMQRRNCGPFVFLDLIGPADMAPGCGVDVRPHPHIGLATVTYLFAGALTHRDSLGSVQVIRPGDVNWMSAGRGIVHSERTPGDERGAGHRMHGLQFWVALPLAHEESEPGFQHVASKDLPAWNTNGTSVRLIAGSASAHTSPVHVFGALFLLDITLQPGATIELAATLGERGLLLMSGDAMADDEALQPQELMLFDGDAATTLRSARGAHLVAFGGAPLDAPRHVSWNFVSSSRERIEQARQAWRAQALGQVPGETEFIPLPDA